MTQILNQKRGIFVDLCDTLFFSYNRVSLRRATLQIFGGECAALMFDDDIITTCLVD